MREPSDFWGKGGGGDGGCLEEVWEEHQHQH